MVHYSKQQIARQEKAIAKANAIAANSRRVERHNAQRIQQIANEKLDTVASVKRAKRNRETLELYAQTMNTNLKKKKKSVNRPTGL